MIPRAFRVCLVLLAGSVLLATSPLAQAVPRTDAPIGVGGQGGNTGGQGSGGGNTNPEKEVAVTNNAGMPIRVVIWNESFNLQPGGVARLGLLGTGAKTVSISASGVLTSDAGTKVVNGRTVRIPPRMTTLRSNTVKNNGGGGQYSVTRSGMSLVIK